MPRPCVAKHPRTVPLECRVCRAYEEDETYREVCDRPTNTDTTPPAQLSRCLHLQPATGEEVRCPSCPGKVSLKLFGCSLHGQCTLANPVQGVACCATCQDRDPPRMGQQQRGWPIRLDHENIAPRWPGKRFNSSITKWGDGYLFAYRHALHGGAIYLVLLDSNFKQCAEVYRPNLRHTKEAEFGQIDPRLFWYKGQLHISFTGVVGHNAQVQDQTSLLYARFDNDLRVEELYCPEYDQRRLIEKNWQFFEYEENGESTLYAVYSIAPRHKILKVEGNRATLVYDTFACPPWQGGELRGSTPPIRVGDVYCSFFHDSLPLKDELKVYRTGFYTFEAKPPFRMTHIIPYPVLTPDSSTRPREWSNILYTCGALRLNDSEWLLSSGVHDSWTELHKLSHAGLMERLVRVGIPDDWQYRPNTDDEVIWNSVYVQNEYDVPERFREQDVVIDLGAHIGTFTKLCIDRGAGAVLALEPAGANYILLEKNVGKDSRVHIQKDAAWFQYELLPLSRGKESHETGSYSVVYGGEPTYEHVGRCTGVPFAEVLLQAIRLSSNGRIRLLKLDCEGAEMEILAGALLLDRVDEITGEYHDRTSYTREHLEGILRTAGFDYVKVGRIEPPWRTSQFRAKRNRQ